MFNGLDIFNDCARRCPDCRCTTFKGARGSDLLTCMDCGKVLRPDELSDPDWKPKQPAAGEVDSPDTI